MKYVSVAAVPDPLESASRELPEQKASWEIAEIVGISLLVVFGLLVVTGFISSVMLDHSYGGNGLAGRYGIWSSQNLTLIFTQGTYWANPESTAVFLIGTLGLTWWQIETWRPTTAEPSELAFIHLARSKTTIKIIFVFALLCVLGAVLQVVAYFLNSPLAGSPGSLVRIAGSAAGTLIICAVAAFGGLRLNRNSGAPESSETLT